jgi:Family of unknown function (DUF5681)
MREKDLKEQPRRRGPGRRFAPGQSGNPAGKPKGARSRVTLLAEKLLEAERQEIVTAVITAAKAGDPTAMRLCIERLMPLRKGRPVSFDLPVLESAADVVGALSAIAKAVAGGALTPDEATAVAGVIEMKRKAIETVEIEERVKKLEEKAK